MIDVFLCIMVISVLDEEEVICFELYVICDSSVLVDCLLKKVMGIFIIWLNRWWCMVIIILFDIYEI